VNTRPTRTRVARAVSADFRQLKSAVPAPLLSETELVGLPPKLPDVAAVSVTVPVPACPSRQSR